MRLTAKEAKAIDYAPAWQIRYLFYSESNSPKEISAWISFVNSDCDAITNEASGRLNVGHSRRWVELSKCVNASSLNVDSSEKLECVFAENSLLESKITWPVQNIDS